MNTDIEKLVLQPDYVIVGCGVSGLYCALNLPEDVSILMLSKDTFETCDSFLAQGGICVLWDEDDYDAYYNDTMKAGHYENNPESVEIMIRSSKDLIKDLINYGVDFAKDSQGNLIFTKEGAHSKNRIAFHEDITGEEITTKLFAAAKAKPNIEMMEYTTMYDLIVEDGVCLGIRARDDQSTEYEILAKETILATGGIGGLYKHSTNFPILTGDALDVAKKYNIQTEHLDYVQIHPTTFIHPTQYYVVYINNLTSLHKETIISSLNAYQAFVGYVDTTFMSIFKSLISRSLMSICIKHKDTMILRHEDDIDDNENINRVS